MFSPIKSATVSILVLKLFFVVLVFGKGRGLKKLKYISCILENTIIETLHANASLPLVPNGIPIFYNYVKGDEIKSRVELSVPAI